MQTIIKNAFDQSIAVQESPGLVGAVILISSGISDAMAMEQLSLHLTPAQLDELIVALEKVQNF